MGFIKKCMNLKYLKFIVYIEYSRWYISICIDSKYSILLSLYCKYLFLKLLRNIANNQLICILWSKSQKFTTRSTCFFKSFISFSDYVFPKITVMNINQAISTCNVHATILYYIAEYNYLSAFASFLNKFRKSNYNSFTVSLMRI